MPTGLTFELLLPEAHFSVKERKLTVSVAGQAVFEDMIDPSLAILNIADKFCGKHGDVVEVTLVDYDEYGNASPKQVNTFVLQDFLPPPKPADVQIRVTGEYNEPSPSAMSRQMQARIVPPTIVAEASSDEIAPELERGIAESENVIEQEVEQEQEEEEEEEEN